MKWKESLTRLFKIFSFLLRYEQRIAQQHSTSNSYLKSVVVKLLNKYFIKQRFTEWYSAKWAFNFLALKNILSV